MSIILPEQLSVLTSMKRWVCHLDKVPKNPFTGGNAMADNSSTWGTYAEAVSAIDRFHFHGLGFQFGLPWDEAEAFELERITGIDLDHVIRDDGSLEPFALEVVTLLDSYTELSPSGTGLHILCKAKFPNTGRRKNVPGTENCMIELYNYAHYFTVTGNIYGEPKNIEVRTTQLEALFKKFFDDIHSAPPMVTDFAPSKIIHHEHLRDINHFLADISSDNELLDKMFNSRNGYAIRKLFSGDTTGYASHSEADMALVSHLAYWTNGDHNRIDTLFRSSGLMREKWDELHGGSTYGQRTIDIVLRDFQPYVPFTPVLQNSQVRSTSYDTTLETPNTKNQTSSPSEIMTQTQTNENTLNNTLISSKNVKSYIVGSSEHWQIKKDLQRFRKFADRKTGFSNIDSKVSFYPGLYVLGAISSLGKTTFIHQMADQLVKNGEHVLFFSLEQTCLELVTKGISRLMAHKDIHTAVSAIDIRRGVDNPLVRQATEEYASFTEHEIILECDFETKIHDIIRSIQNYIQETSVLPIVIIDYLQVICPSDTRQTTKDAVDTHVRAFKKLQKDFDLTIILVSSLNRQNYLTPIDYESFKESGGIEYTADVLWGLQLQVINDDIFDQDKKLKSKRDKIKSAKNARPREIEFVCLKNRYGESNYTCRFLYYAQFDYFIPIEPQYSCGVRL